MDSAGPTPQDPLARAAFASEPSTEVAPPPLTERRGSATEAPPLIASGTLVLFAPDRARLALLLEFQRRRVQAVLWVLVVGAALGLLWLLPQVRAFPLQTHPSLLVRILRDLFASKGAPWWALALRVPGVLGPALALIALCWLPGALWREARLRRQSALHLAIGRQGLLFFLPGQARRWWLLPWEQISDLSEETIRPASGRRARLSSVLWRRLARLRRLYRHGHRLDATGTRRAVQSPFAARALMQQPRLALHLFCSGRLPTPGYGWLFRLAPLARRAGPETLRLETGWFVAASSRALPGRPKRAEGEAGPLHQVVLALWRDRALADLYPLLPVPRYGGTFQLSTAGAAGAAPPAARQIRLASWAMLPLLPALSLTELAEALGQGQPLPWAGALNAGTECAIALGLALLLAGMQPPRRARAVLAGALVLALGGLLNASYGVAAFLLAWPWSFSQAPGQPFAALDVLVGLLVLLGALAFALEGDGRPLLRPITPDDARLRLPIHSAELVLGLGLLGLGLARVLEDVNLAALSQSDGAALQLLRNTLAEPLLPLAMLGLSYFRPLAGPVLGRAFRALQAVYGLVLAGLVPVAFVLVHRALGGSGLPLPWLPLLALMLLGGLLAAGGALFGKGHA